MKDSDILAFVDHTILSPAATWAQVAVVCREAIKYKTASVCIPPSYVKQAHDTYGDSLNICTVVGFPLGYSNAAAKIKEVETALKEGASEIDMVINIGDAKDKKYDKITSEIQSLKKACGDKILKVIIECCYLEEAEKIAMCKCVTEGGADFIKTSTGFGSGGATPEDIRLFKAHIGKSVKIKAAGGMRTKDDFELYIKEGCTRLGTSSAVKVLQGEASSDY